MSHRPEVVTYDELGIVGLIRIDNPPVNALNHEVRAKLSDAIVRAERSAQIKVALIMSGENMFSAGADLKEFDGPLGEPSLQQLQAAIEAAPVPVVAAISGFALGGGLELALACHYRLAHKSAKLGLPEITRGSSSGGLRLCSGQLRLQHYAHKSTKHTYRVGRLRSCRDRLFPALFRVL